MTPKEKKFSVNQIQVAFKLAYPVTSFDAEAKRNKHLFKMLELLRTDKDIQNIK